MKTNKIIRVPSELMWVFGMILLPFAVTLCTKANLGMSMIASPTYIVSEKTPLSYGQTEYIFQAIVLFLMCVIIKKFKLAYLSSFVSAIVYGTVLDLFIWLLRDFTVTQLWARIAILAFSMVITSFSIACFMKSYLAPCAYDYLVKMVVEVKGLELKKVKLINDISYLVLSVLLSLVLFRGFVGVYWGTLVMALLNGFIISFFSKLIDNHCEFFDCFPKLAKFF